MPEQALRARLGCSKLLLARLAGKAGFHSASQIQSAAFVDLAKGAQLSNPERAELSDMALTCGFAEEQLASVLEVLSPAQGKKTQRNGMQDYTTILAFFTEADWDDISDDAANFHSIKDVIFQRVKQLGARCPCEKTKQIFTCIILLKTTDSKRAIRTELKHSTMNSVRSLWASFIRGASSPTEYIPKLESTIQLFKEKHPAMYRLAYGDGPGPVPARICAVSVEALAETFKCRPGALLDSPSSSAVASQAPTLHLPGGGLEHMAQAIFTQMEKNAERQERMMQIMMEGSLGPRTKRSRTGELEDLLVHRAGSRELHLEAPSPPSSPPPAAIEDVQRKGSVESVGEEAPADQSSKGEEAPADQSSKEAPANQNALNLLSLLEERDVKKKLQAKIAKAEAKANAKAAPSDGKGKAGDDDAPQPQDEKPPKSDKGEADSAALSSGGKGRGNGRGRGGRGRGAARGAADAIDEQPVTQQVVLPAAKMAKSTKQMASKSSPSQSTKMAADKASPLPAAKSKQMAADEASPGEEVVTYSVERSRNQVMVRVGKKGNRKCYGFKYGEDHKHATEDDAVSAAKAWIEAGRPELSPA